MIRNIRLRDLSTEHLLTLADEAVAWGVPDNESMGYSPEHWNQLVHELSRRIRDLMHPRPDKPAEVRAVLSLWEKNDG